MIYGLAVDYYDQYRASVRAVTAVDVLTAARTHLDPTRLQVVVVGDPDANAYEPILRSHCVLVHRELSR